MRSVLIRCGIALLVMSFVNCSSWRATQAPLREMEGDNVRVTTKEGGKQEGRLLHADSLGFAVLHCSYCEPRVVAIDTSKIAGVEKRVHSAGRTAALVLVPPLLFVAFIAIGSIGW